MGAVSTQNGHPISFFSKKICPKLKKSSTYVRELHAITSPVQKQRHYLLGKQCTIETDQKSLRELINQVVQTPNQHYYLTKSLGYDYIISYKPRKTNKMADALSRKDIIATFQYISNPTFDFLAVL